MTETQETDEDYDGELWSFRAMWSEAYCCACAVDQETAYLVQEAYQCGQIEREMAEQLWWGNVGQTVDPSSNSDSVQ